MASDHAALAQLTTHLSDPETKRFEARRVRRDAARSQKANTARSRALAGVA